MTENNRKNNHSWRDRLSRGGGVLRILKRNVVLQASLAIATVVLTIVLIFSLSVAWYTNVVQSGGLALNAEEWNFDGKIELLEDLPIVASPGDEGVIPLRITNDGEHIVAASATMDKSDMAEEMRKRLYFYVDTSMKRHDETVDRVFISEKSSYTYTIPAHSTLELSETVKNGPLIKWMWVYDVLGYYVWGQNTNGSVEPLDYIRPVEYDYDPATTTFDTNGNLLTVDGSLPVADFVAKLTASDGYAGTLDLENTEAVAGYYPVSVNEDGYGVWLYLCTRDDIQENMEFDTSVGADPSISYKATVTITGQNSREDSMPIATAKDLQTALSDPTVGMIRLTDNIELVQSLQMNGGSAVIDLNGNTLTAAAGVDQIVKLTSGAKLSIENGTIAGDEGTNGETAIQVDGSHLIMNTVTIENVDTGVRISDNADTVESSSTISMRGGKINARLYGVRVDGNSAGTQTRTQVVMRDATIEGEGYAGVLFSGNYVGTDTLISNCIVSGKYAAIYHPPKDSTLTIQDNSTLTGGTGIVVKGGDVTVKDSVVQGTMVGTDPTYNPSGWADTGDGIYLEANYASENPDWSASVTVINCNVLSNHGYAVRQYQKPAANTSFTVHSGSYLNFASDVATVPEGFDAAKYMQDYKADSSTAANMDNGGTKNCTVTAGASTP